MDFQSRGNFSYKSCLKFAFLLVSIGKLCLERIKCYQYYLNGVIHEQPRYFKFNDN